MDEAINDGLLEKLRICASKPQEGVETIRTLAAKIHAHVTSSGMNTQFQSQITFWLHIIFRSSIMLAQGCCTLWCLINYQLTRGLTGGW